MMNPLAVIDKFYPADDELRRLLLVHSWHVADMALRCEARHPELGLDRSLLLRGALVHDIGIVGTNAPRIHCYGDMPYLMHGFIGARMLRTLGLEAEARICERHTGTGLSRQVISESILPIESRDYFPESMEEKLVCYADKFYSKSRPNEVKTFEQACNSLMRFGEDGVRKFCEWNGLFN